MIAKSKGWYVSVLTAAAMAAVSTPSTTTTTTSSSSSPSMNHVVSAFLPIQTNSNRLSRMSSSLLLPVPTGTRSIDTPNASTHLYESIQQSHHSNEHEHENSSRNSSGNNDNELDGTEKSVRSIRMTSTTSNKNDDDLITITPNERSNGGVDDASITTTTTTVKVDAIYPFNDQINTFVESSSTSSSSANMNHTLTDSTVVPSSSPSSSSSSSFTLEETKQIRVAKAQAEIDRILSHPDGPPFDIESEMKKVISINCDDENVDMSEHQDEDNDDDISRSSGVTRRSLLPTNTKKITTQLLTDEKQIEMIMDRHEEMTSYDIESQLYEAIRKQDYSTAAVQQKALQQLQYDATIQVLQCNSAFYKAFSKKDYKSMELLWLPNDPHVLCIHPSHVPIVSSHNINQSWKQMFTSNGSFQKTWIEPTNIRINVRGNHMAIVTCDEQVYIRRFVRGQKRQTELINTLTATNIFYKLHQRWYMIHHHASWHPSSDAAKTALSRSTGSSSSSSSSSSYIASLKKRQEAMDAQNSSNDNNNKNNGLDGILGMKGVGPLLGDLKPKKLLSPGSQQQNASPPPQRRIVMGSLSDILNGNLEDLLNGGGVAGGGNKNSDKKGNDDEGSAIIQFHRIDSEDDDDEDDDDEDIDLELDDDEEDDDDEADDVEEEVDIDISTKVSRSNGKKEAISMIQEWASRRGSDDDNDKKNTNAGASNKKQSEVDMTIQRQQQCLTLIRQLCSEGLISQQHKRTLLTDMISSSNGSTSSTAPTVRKSRIQLAYEFLFAKHLDDANDETDDTMYDIAREEFADQCRIIAESMSSQS